MTETSPAVAAAGSRTAKRIVTRIEPVRGSVDACRVYVDEVLLGTVPADVLAELRVVRQRVLDPDALQRLTREAGILATVRKALQLLSYRPRTKREIEMRLHKAGHDSDAIATAVERCERLGYLDDAAFARSFVRDRLRLKPRGSRALVAELIGKGVERGVAREAVSAGFDEFGVSESDMAFRLAETRLRAVRHLEPIVARRRLSAYLGRRGFSSDVTREVVARAMAADLPDDGAGAA